MWTYWMHRHISCSHFPLLSLLLTYKSSLLFLIICQSTLLTLITHLTSHQCVWSMWTYWMYRHILCSHFPLFSLLLTYKSSLLFLIIRQSTLLTLLTHLASQKSVYCMCIWKYGPSTMLTFLTHLTGQESIFCMLTLRISFINSTHTFHSSHCL